MALRPRAVIVYRLPELEELLARHSTRGQAEFFLRTRGRSLKEVESRHDAFLTARATITAALPATWAVAMVERADLTRFFFAPEDVILAVGQDGLVANVAKYLKSQLVIGVNPEPGVNPGVLVRHSPAEAAGLIARLGDDASGAIKTMALTMVEAEVDDGQRLRALNEVFIGHPSHQSARYTLRSEQGEERQSSSGVIVSTGTGATGWSLSIQHDRGTGRLPAPTEPELVWYVREAWPSPASGAEMTTGWLGPKQALSLTVASDRLVLFGDGLESDAITLSWGQDVKIQMAADHLRLA